MIISRSKILIFFLIVLILGWFLYPRELFLGYIYEGTEDLEKSVFYYENYLQEKPYNKFATFRLAMVYERMAEPEKALSILERLYQYRSDDWRVARYLLDKLEDYGDQERLYQIRKNIIQSFKNRSYFPQERLFDLLEENLAYARWNHLSSEAYQTLSLMSELSYDAQVVEDIEYELDRGLKKYDKIIKKLRAKFDSNSSSLYEAQDLASLYRMFEDYNKSLYIIKEALRRDPLNKDFLLLRSNIYEELKKYKNAISDLTKLSQDPSISEKERHDLIERMAFLYQQINQSETALTLYDLLIDENPNKKSYYLSRYYLLIDLDRQDEAQFFLEDLLKKFPEDLSLMKDRVAYFLYEKKQYQPQLFRDYLLKSLDAQVGLDVVYLLMDQKLFDQALDWIHYSETILSLPLEVRLAQIDIYRQSKENKRALDLALSLEDKFLNSTKILWVLFELSGLEGKFQEAQVYLELYLKQSQRLPDNLRDVGKMLYFWGFSEEAFVYLNESYKSYPKDAETMFYLSQVLWETRQKKEARALMFHLIHFLESEKTNLSQVQVQYLLKTKGFLDYNSDVLKAYELAFKKYPHSSDLYFDLIDLHLINKKIETAKSTFSKLKSRFPGSHQRWPVYLAQIATLEKKWDEAALQYQKALEVLPWQWKSRRDLAFVYRKMREWRKSFVEYENVLDQAPQDLISMQALRQMKDDYHHRVGHSFEHRDLEGDESYEWSFFYRGFLKDDIRFHFEFETAQYFFGPNDFEGQAQQFILEASFYQLKDFIFTPSIESSFSFKRKVLSPAFQIDYSYHDIFFISLAYTYHKLRKDVAQAVEVGALQDDLQVNLQYNFKEKWTLSHNFHYKSDHLPEGETARTLSLNPSLSFLALSQPNISFSYSYFWKDIKDENDFFSRFALIPKISSHTIRIDMNHWFGDRLYIESAFFASQDTARNLNFFKGDLWGSHAKFRYVLNRYLDLETTYDYSRENLSSIAGESHRFHIGLSGHWL